MGSTNSTYAPCDSNTTPNNPPPYAATVQDRSNEGILDHNRKLGYKADSVPKITWTKNQCRAWIAIYAVDCLELPMKDAFTYCMTFNGSGASLYTLTEIESWSSRMRDYCTGLLILQSAGLRISIGRRIYNLQIQQQFSSLTRHKNSIHRLQPTMPFRAHIKNLITTKLRSQSRSDPSTGEDKRTSETKPPIYDPESTIIHSYRSLGISALDVPRWTWSNKECKAWIAIFCIDMLSMSSKDSVKAADSFHGAGGTIYNYGFDNWKKMIGEDETSGNEKSYVIYGFLQNVQKEKCAKYQTSRGLLAWFKQTRERAIR